MADEILKRDQNFVTVLAGITNDSDQDITMLRVDPITKRLLINATGITPGVTGSGSPDQVAIWDSLSSITGYDNLKYENGQLKINSGVAPSTATFQMSANSLGGLNLLSYSPGDQEILFDMLWSGNDYIAQHTTVGGIFEINSNLEFYLADGQTIGNPASYGLSKFTISPNGQITIPNLGGAGGTVMVTADDNGVLSYGTISTGTVTGTGVAGRVAFWDGTSNITHSAGLIYDSMGQTLGVNTITDNGLGGGISIFTPTPGISIGINSGGNLQLDTSANNNNMRFYTGTGLMEFNQNNGVYNFLSDDTFLHYGTLDFSAITTTRNIAFQDADGTVAYLTDITTGIGGSTGAVDNAILRADGTGGSTLQASGIVLGDAGSKNAIFNISAISSTDKTFTFLNQSGNVVATADPGANTIYLWDDTDNLPVNAVIGTGLTYTHSTHTLSSSAGMSIGGTVTSGTAGSILFVGTGPVLAQDNANFFFDDTNNRLGIQTNTPTNALSFGSGANQKIWVEPGANTAAGKNLTIQGGNTNAGGGALGTFTGLSQGNKGWIGMAVTTTGNVYAVDYTGDIYMQTSGTGNFNALSQTSRTWAGMAVNPLNNNVYAATENADIYMQTGGTGNFVALGLSNAIRYGMTATAGGNIYAAIFGGDIYMQTAGSGAFNALSQGNKDWIGMATASNGDVYASVSNGDIYKQTGGTGNFVALGQTSRTWRGMGSDSLGNVFATVFGGDIYMQTGGTGNFVGLSQTSRNWWSLVGDANNNMYSGVYLGDIYEATFSGGGTADLAGGRLILSSGQGKGTGDSSIGLFTGTTLGSGTVLQTLSEKMTILGNGNVGIGQTTPTAALHLKAGTATASTAPLKFTSGTNLTSAEIGTMEYNNALYFTNWKSLRYSMGGVIKDFYASVGNVGTGEDDLYTFTTIANTLGTNGDKIEAEYGGTFVNSATATREVKLYFAGTAIFDTGALTLSLSSAWTMFATVIRVSSTVVRYMVSFTTEGAALAAYTAVGELTGLTLSGTNIIKITGESAGVGAASNDVVAVMGSISFVPAV